MTTTLRDHAFGFEPNRSRSHSCKAVAKSFEATVHAESQLPAVRGSTPVDDAGMLQLKFRAGDPGGATTDAVIAVSSAHADGQKMIGHLGGGKPGEQKLVPPGN